MTQQRTFFGEIKPYAVPDSLEALGGPDSGMVTLPAWVYWAPGQRTFDVGTRSGAKRASIAVLSEGVLDEVCEVVNAQRLRQLWDAIVIPRRSRALWEQRFPELAGGGGVVDQREQQRMVDRVALAAINRAEELCAPVSSGAPWCGSGPWLCRPVVSCVVLCCPVCERSCDPVSYRSPKHSFVDSTA